MSVFESSTLILLTYKEGLAYVNKGRKATMEASRILKNIFHTILLFLSIGFFTFHVKGVIEESLEKKTTVAITQVHFTHLSPPPITLCPGQIINLVKLKKKYGSIFDIFTSNPFVNKSDHPHVKSHTPLELFMDISYVLGKDLELVINTYNDNHVQGVPTSFRWDFLVKISNLREIRILKLSRSNIFVKPK